MALMTTKPPSSPGSDSHASSEELDQPSPDMLPADPANVLHASPISLPNMLIPTQPPPDADREPQSSRSTPTRSSPVDARARSTSRGGCWTCRVRRKKCDEERVEDDSCKTCRRLGIQCLGWGPKRPDWMRDKEKVAEYKADIKAQLTRAGLIRGQPRAIYNSLTAGAPIPGPYASGSGVDRYAASAVAGPGPSTLRRSRGHDYGSLYATHPRYDAPAHPHLARTMSGVPGLTEPLGAPADLDMFSYNHGSAAYASPDLRSLAQGVAGYPPGPPTGPAAAPRAAPPDGQDYVAYYFQHVRQLQFVFAGNSLTETLYIIVAAEPHGAVAHALCALAALHSARTGASYAPVDGTQQPGEQPVHRGFYDQACYLLSNVKTMGSQYSETDAVAAIYLIAYQELLGGGTSWLTLLEVAYDWFGQTGIHEEQNPKLRLVNMSSVQKFAAKATMWMDIMSSVVFVRPPRFLAVYRRLFGQGGTGGAGFWAATNNDQLDLRMDKLVGCPDEAVLAIAETAALASWKKSEGAQGTLSTRELVRRGDAVEQTLRTRPARTFAESPTVETALPAGLPAAAGTVYDLAGPNEAQRNAVAQIYRDAALLYLHTVLDGPHPGVPEMGKCVGAILDSIQSIPPSDFDRAFIFPIVLTGCMAPLPFFRDMLRSRCSLHNDAYVGGSFAQALGVIQRMWERREACAAQPGVGVDWRDVVRESWSSLFTT